MPRIPYLDDTISEPYDLVNAIRKRRGGNLLHLDRQLLHSPAFAKGWNAMFGSIRNELALSPKLRELAMCAVATLNGAEYELHQHGPEFIKSGGTQDQLNALLDPKHAITQTNLFNSTEIAALQLTIEMTRNVQVSTQTFENMVKRLDGNHQHVIELIGVIAGYNMVSRFLVALDIQPEDH